MNKIPFLSSILVLLVILIGCINQGKESNIASNSDLDSSVKPRIIATSDGEIDDQCSMIRFLLYANEWASTNINVNAIAPGNFVTDNTEDLVNDPARNRQISERIPAGRWGIPDDMKGAVVFLASSTSDYVNGHILLVDGGWMAR